MIASLSGAYAPRSIVRSSMHDWRLTMEGEEDLGCVVIKIAAFALGYMVIFFMIMAAISRFL